MTRIGILRYEKADSTVDNVPAKRSVDAEKKNVQAEIIEQLCCILIEML